MYSAVDEATREASLTAAWDSGIRYFDTAPHYGPGCRSTASAMSCGSARARNSCSRPRSAGCRCPTAPPRARVQVFVDALPFRPVYDYSADGTRRSIEDSLQRLGLSHIDIAYIHDIAEDTHGPAWEGLFDQAMDGAARALTRLREEGVIRAWGLGVNLTEPCLRALDRADPDVFLLAGRYSLIDHAALDALFPACAARGVHVVVGGPFNSGLLAGGRTFDYALAAPAEVMARDRVAAVCGRHGVDIRAAALQFCAAHPVVASVIPGAKGAARVRENAALMRAPIPADFWAELKAEGLLPEDGARPPEGGTARLPKGRARGMPRPNPEFPPHDRPRPRPPRPALRLRQDRPGRVRPRPGRAGASRSSPPAAPRKALREAGLPGEGRLRATGFPEMMDGRVKTLHPKVHGGLLGRARRCPSHAAAMAEHGIAPIDLVGVNLYPFEATVADGRRLRRLHREHRHRRPGDDPLARPRTTPMSRC